jgi:hypothetical protein
MKTFKGTLIFIFFMAWMPIVAEAQQGEVTLEFENAASAMELAQAYTAALQAGDVSRMDGLLHKTLWFGD